MHRFEKNCLKPNLAFYKIALQAKESRISGGMRAECEQSVFIY